MIVKIKAAALRAWNSPSWRRSRTQMLDVAERAANTAWQAGAPVFFLAVASGKVTDVSTAKAAAWSATAAGGGAALAFLKGYWATGRGDGSASVLDLGVTPVFVPDGSADAIPDDELPPADHGDGAGEDDA